MKPRVKICCIASEDEARLAIQFGAAIDAVQPFGVDLCSGVRSNGRLDPKKLEAFFKAAWG